MPHNSSLAGTQHIRAIADRTLEATKGLQIKVPTKGDAIRMRAQFNNLRMSDRRQSKIMYKEDDPRYGTSAYDSIETRLEEKDGECCLIFRTVLASVSDLELTDIATGEEIKPEDL